MKNTLYRLLFVAAIAALSLGCSNDDDPIAPTTPTTPTPPPTQEGPTEDLVETTFSGEVALLANGGDQLIGYLQKRFSNTSSDLTSGVHAVLLDESGAAMVLENANTLALAVSLWEQGGAAIFIQPGQKSLELISTMNAALVGGVAAEIPAEVTASYADIHLMIVQADGDALLYNRIDRQKKVYTTTQIVKDNEGDEAVEQTLDPRESTLTITPTDYQLGRIAERASEWLNRYFTADSQPLHSAFRTTRSEESGYSATIDYHPQITVDHTMGYDHGWCSKGECPASDTTEALVRISVISGWNEEMQKDVYDITLTEAFDATDTYYLHELIHEYMEYNYRYSGGFYYGPTVETYLTTAVSGFSMENNSTLYSPVPVAESGSYTVTHDPGSTTLGGGVSVGAGSSGVMATGSFNFSVTLPKTTVAVSEDEMPVNHQTNYRDYINWDYRSTFEIEHTSWGFNPDYSKPPLINRSDCELTQAATFAVGNSDQLGNTPTHLNCTVKFKTYHELAQAEIISGSSHIKEYVDHCFTVPSYALPIVKRFSERYSPVCCYNSGDINSWETLQSVLVRNANYKALNDGYEICASTEEGVEAAAKVVWESALEDLVETNKAHDAIYEYVIMLKDENNPYLPMALHIKGKTWEILPDGVAFLKTLG